MQLLSAMADTSILSGFLRPMTIGDLASVLAMRNHAAIRRYMLTQYIISVEEHSKWFERTQQNPGIELLVFELNAKCCGFVQLKETTYEGVVDWGFYAAPDAPKGTGRNLGLSAIDYAFNRTNLHKICGQALHWNRPSIQFHESLGFAQEGVLRRHHFDGASYHDLICFGLHKDDWASKELRTGRSL